MNCRALLGLLLISSLWMLRGVGATEHRNGPGDAFYLGSLVADAQQESERNDPHPPQKSPEAQAPPAQPQQAEAGMHSIALQFDYDFTKTPACSAKVKKSCVQQFVAYDISGPKPYFLFSFPVPDGAQGAMKGIKATSPRLLFALGKHRIGVSARMPNGEESPPRDCKTIIDIQN